MRDIRILERHGLTTDIELRLTIDDDMFHVFHCRKTQPVDYIDDKPMIHLDEACDTYLHAKN